MQTHPVPVDNNSYISSYLQLMNGLLKLSDMELKVLEVFVKHHGKVNQQTRLIAQEELKLKAVTNVNNYVKSLKDKRILLPEDNNTYLVNPKVMPSIGGISFTFVWK